MSDDQTLDILRDSDEIVLMNDPPNFITVWNELIFQANPHLLTETPDGYLIFTFTNIKLEYKIVARSLVMDSVMAILVSSEPV